MGNPVVTSDAQAAESSAGAAQLQGFHQLTLDQVLESAPDAMLIIGPSGDIVYLNTLAAKLFGYERNELLGRAIETLVPAELRRAHGEHRKGYFKEPRARLMETGLELYGLRKDASRFPIEISLSPLHTSAGTLVLGAVRDRTKRQQMEAEIRELNRDLEAKVRELDTMNREMQDFSYTTAHDLRAPVRHMLSFTQMVRKSAAERLEASELQYLDKVAGSAKRLGTLIDDLLNFSRLGRATMAQQAVALNRVIQEIRDGFQKEVRQRNIDWQISDLPTVSGDAVLLRTLFTNLLENAVKFTRARQEAIIEIGRRVENGCDVIFVRDNGAGFDEEFSGKLFQIFQRLHSADEFEGSGIGLATVRRIAERHGGRVWAEGEKDRGATFFVALPVATQGGSKG